MVLDAHDDIEVVHAMSHDDATEWSDEQFGEFDCAVVEVIDELARNEAGTDLFSGIDALERLRRLPVTTYAVTPHRHHPIVEQRIYQSGADFIYRQFEINDAEWFVSQLISPDESHRVRPVPSTELQKFGAERSRTNDAVDALERLTTPRTSDGECLALRAEAGGAAPSNSRRFRRDHPPHRIVDTRGPSNDVRWLGA